MSTARAITQLVKSRAKFKLKLSVLEEEKEAALAATTARYAEKEKDLKASFSEAENALKALGLTDEKITELTTELAE